VRVNTIELQIATAQKHCKQGTGPEDIFHTRQTDQNNICVGKAEEVIAVYSTDGAARLWQVFRQCSTYLVLATNEPILIQKTWAGHIDKQSSERAETTGPWKTAKVILG